MSPVHTFARLHDAIAACRVDRHVVAAQEHRSRSNPARCTRRFLLFDAARFVGDDAFRARFPHLHEVLDDRLCPLRLTFDIDIERPLVPGADAAVPETFAGKFFRRDFEMAVRMTVQRHYGGAPAADRLRFVWLRSVGNPCKLSYHLVVHHALIASMSKELRRFYDLLSIVVRAEHSFGALGVNPFARRDESETGMPFDRALCARSHTLRMCGMCKFEQSHPLQVTPGCGRVAFVDTLSCGHRFGSDPRDAEQLLGMPTNDSTTVAIARPLPGPEDEQPSLDDGEIDDAMHLLRTSPLTRHIASALRLRGVRGHLVLLDRVAPSRCPRCNRTTPHTSEGAFMSVTSPGNVFYYCRRAMVYADEAGRPRPKGLLLGNLIVLRLRRKSEARRRAARAQNEPGAAP